MCGQGLCLERDAGVWALPTKMQKLSPPFPNPSPTAALLLRALLGVKRKRPLVVTELSTLARLGTEALKMGGVGVGCVSVQVEILHLP